MKKAEARTVVALERERERERESYTLINKKQSIKNAFIMMYIKQSNY